MVVYFSICSSSCDKACLSKDPGSKPHSSFTKPLSCWRSSLQEPKSKSLAKSSHSVASSCLNPTSRASSGHLSPSRCFPPATRALQHEHKAFRLSPML